MLFGTVERSRQGRWTMRKKLPAVKEEAANKDPEVQDGEREPWEQRFQSCSLKIEQPQEAGSGHGESRGREGCAQGSGMGSESWEKLGSWL